MMAAAAAAKFGKLANAKQEEAARMEAEKVKQEVALLKRRAENRLKRGVSDAKLSDEETAILKRHFDLMDEDGSGEMDKEEFFAFYKKIGGETLTKKELDDLFDSLDADGGGALSFDEFVKVYAKMTEAELQKKDPTKYKSLVAATEKTGFGHFGKSMGNLKGGASFRRRSSVASHGSEGRDAESDYDSAEDECDSEGDNDDEKFPDDEEYTGYELEMAQLVAAEAATVNAFQRATVKTKIAALKEKMKARRGVLRWGEAQKNGQSGKMFARLKRKKMPKADLDYFFGDRDFATMHREYEELMQDPGAHRARLTQLESMMRKRMEELARQREEGRLRKERMDREKAAELDRKKGAIAAMQDAAAKKKAAAEAEAKARAESIAQGRARANKAAEQQKVKKEVEVLKRRAQLRAKRGVDAGTQISDEETAILKRHFDLMDEDGSGEMDKEEFFAFYQKIGGNVLSKKDLDFLFDSLDEDGGGTMSFDEFVKVYAYVAEAENAKKAGKEVKNLFGGK